MKLLKRTFTTILALSLLSFGTLAQQPAECTWRTVTAGVVLYGRDLIKANPEISKTEFKSLMSKRLTAAKTEHKNCPSREHRTPAIIVGSCAIKDTMIAAAVRADFLNPRSSYWGWVMSR